MKMFVKFMLWYCMKIKEMSREYGGARKNKCSSRKDVKSQSPISTNLKSKKKKRIKIKIRISMSVYKAEFYVVIIMSLYVVTLI